MFILSKLIGALTAPLTLILLMLLSAAALHLVGLSRAGRRLAAAAVLFMTALAVLPWQSMLIEPLENRFPQPTDLPGRIDGIVVLGGAFDPVGTVLRNQVSANGAVERVTAMVDLARKHPEAKLVFSGGSGSISQQEFKEAPVVRRFLSEIGFDSDRVMYEDQSRNTRENALFAKEIAAPAENEVWVLITSAVHMPRSVGTFRQAGWSIIPYPVDFKTYGEAEFTLNFNVEAGAGALIAALHEGMGMVYYRLRGWSDQLYPQP